MSKLIVLILLTGFFCPLWANPKISPSLQQKMNQSTESEFIPVYVLFDSHLTLQDFADIPYDTPRNERRKIVIERLQQYAEHHQANVKSFLNMQKSMNAVQNYEVLWVSNAIVTTSNRDAILELTKFNEVSMIYYDYPTPTEELTDVVTPRIPFNTNNANPMTINPGIPFLKADLCWAEGNKGKGVLVGNVDNGFWWRHPDLVKGVYQNLGEDANHNGMTVIWGTGTTSAFDAGDVNGIDDDGNGKVDDFIGWNFATNTNNPATNDHGTATLSQIIGDGTMGTQTGVAPEAKCIIMRNDGTNGGTQANQWLGFQYALLMGADVITSSLSWKWGSPTDPPNYSQFRLVTDISLAAGVMHTNSTSNDANIRGIPNNISTAGNCPPPWLHPDQLKRGGIGGVIGTANIDVSTGLIHSTSPYGPTTWGNWSLWGSYTFPIDSAHKDYPYSRVAPIEVPDSMGLLKPDVAAPGDGTLACYVLSGTGYGSPFLGTSSATPHTAGVVALMLSINPELLPQDIAKIIQMTAIDMGTPGKDERYGAGKIDAYASTNSPKFVVAGINGGSNMLINSTLAASDTARELVGIKISTSLNPQVGSLRTLKFGMTTTATASNITSFDLYFDKDKNGFVSTGDVKLKSRAFASGPITFDSIKFKFLDTARTLLLVARTTASASGSQTVNIGLTDTNQVKAYYNTTAAGTNFPFGSVTGTGNTNMQIISYSLSQNFPNPFNPSTQISYSLAKEGFVTIKLYNILGKEIATLVNNHRTAGTYEVELNTDNLKLSSGIYYYTIESNGFSDTKKMILLK
ncbi:MAG: S8 family peptidase [Bacteroidetes bacterium]|nr:S8 family peptidase [Bacteroidota bacterium]